MYNKVMNAIEGKNYCFAECIARRLFKQSLKNDYENRGENLRATASALMNHREAMTGTGYTDFTEVYAILLK